MLSLFNRNAARITQLEVDNRALTERVKALEVKVAALLKPEVSVAEEPKPKVKKKARKSHGKGWEQPGHFRKGHFRKCLQADGSYKKIWIEGYQTKKK